MTRAARIFAHWLRIYALGSVIRFWTIFCQPGTRHSTIRSMALVRIPPLTSFVKTMASLAKIRSSRCPIAMIAWSRTVMAECCSASRINERTQRSWNTAAASTTQRLIDGGTSCFHSARTTLAPSSPDEARIEIMARASASRVELKLASVRTSRFPIRFAMPQRYHNDDSSQPGSIP